MSTLWDRVRSGFSRTDVAIQKLKAEGRTGPVAPIKSSNTPPISPFDAIEAAKKREKLPPPTQLWMQSHFIRGSTQKMTGLARQIIGLPLDAALLQMYFSKRKMARTVVDVLSNMKGTLRQKGADPAYFYIKSATVGRGVYLKRLEIRARGQHGVQWRGHAFIRICAHRPDPLQVVKKMLKIKKFPREDRPVMKKLDYN